MRPLRILHVLDHSVPLQSGYTFRTLAILREQSRRGWQTLQLTGPKQTGCEVAEEIVDGLRFHRTAALAARMPAPLDPLAVMRALRARLHEVAGRERPDLLHAHSPVLNALPALSVGRRLGIPVVYEVRAFWEDAAVDHGTTREGSLRYRLTRALETRALRRAARVTTICEGLRGDIVARGIDAARVTVIPNAVDPDLFEVGGSADAALRERLGLAGRTVVGFIGSFYAYEGLDLLVDAMPAIRARRADAALLLVGGGPGESDLKRRAAALGVADHVVFTGRVPHQDVQRYYDLVDVFAYPRHSMRLTELVTPLKPLEAMARGRLLVASDVGGHRELIRDGVTGVLFRAGDAGALAAALCDLLDRPRDWPGLRAAGREFVTRERTWADSVGRYAAVYAGALGRAIA
jgi:PEP-CTERM/exosortase A-associated glycosyltransferase